MLNVGHVLTADAIIDHVWGAGGGDRDMLRQLVRRLRGKIKELGDGVGDRSDRASHRDNPGRGLWPDAG